MFRKLTPDHAPKRFAAQRNVKFCKIGSALVLPNPAGVKQQEEAIATRKGSNRREHSPD
jgi:hypothetical protein